MKAFSLQSARSFIFRVNRFVTRISLWSSCALLLSAAPANAFDFDRPIDRGGRIGDYIGRIVAGAARRHVISGDCMSACTMWLGHKGVCVTADAVLWFHAARETPSDTGNPWRGVSAAGNRALLAMYPARLRAVVRPWLESGEFHSLTGLQLAALGVPLCPDDGSDGDSTSGRL